MTITADYHLHTHNSGDSTAPMEDMIKKGISLGLTTMGFTEHMDMDYVYGKPEEAGMFELNTDSYLYELATLKEKYENKFKAYYTYEKGKNYTFLLIKIENVDLYKNQIKIW